MPLTLTITALHVKGTIIASPAYSWSPMPGGTISQWGPALCSVMSTVIFSLAESGRHHPTGQCLSSVLEERKCSNAVNFPMMLSP